MIYFDGVDKTMEWGLLPLGHVGSCLIITRYTKCDMIDPCVWLHIYTSTYDCLCV